MNQVSEFSKERLLELQKDAKSFIKKLQKKQQLLAEEDVIMLPIFKKFGVKHSWDIPSEYWSSMEWQTSNIKKLTQQISSKVIRLNRLTKKLKYSFWAIYPKGTEEYYEIYPTVIRK